MTDPYPDANYAQFISEKMTDGMTAEEAEEASGRAERHMIPHKEKVMREVRLLLVQMTMEKEPLVRQIMYIACRATEITMTYLPVNPRSMQLEYDEVSKAAMADIEAKIKIIERHWQDRIEAFIRRELP